MAHSPLLSLVGFSGSGKTTLLTSLLPILSQRGKTVSAVKHTHHRANVDRPGKDSFRFREAGAFEVVLSNIERFALIQERRGRPEALPEELLAKMAPVDLILIEGFRASDLCPKIEVHRPSLNKPFLFKEIPGVIALASDTPEKPLPEACKAGITLLPLNNPEVIADFILSRVLTKQAFR